MVAGFVLASTLIFALLGHSKGLVRQIIGIVALVLAFIFAEQVGAAIPGTFIERMGIPLLLRPGAQKGLGALIVLVGAIVAGNLGALVLASGQSSEAAAEHRRRDQARGAVLGAVKGFLIAMLILVVVYNLGQVAEVVDQRVGPAEEGDVAKVEEGSNMRRTFAMAKKNIERSALGGGGQNDQPVRRESHRASG